MSKPQRDANGNKPAQHERDEDCKPFLVDDACSVCGVVHWHACHRCGGRGFHKEGCEEI